MSSESSARSGQREYPATNFIRRLVAAGSDLGDQLERSLEWSLREYLVSLIPRPAPEINPHRTRFVLALEKYLVARDEVLVDEVCTHLLRLPVIQQADHSNLLLDSETFLNNFLFYVASREVGAKIIVVSQCSTVSCLSKRIPVTGSVFLRTRGRLYRVFPFSKRMLKDSSFCCLPAPMTMTFDLLEGSEYALEKDPLLGRFVGRHLTDAPEGYRTCNDEIWRSLDLDQSLRRVAVDESLASECVAMHLEDALSPVFQLLFDYKVRDTFLRVKRRLVAAPENITVNRSAPDFLWFRKGTRLLPVILVGDKKNAYFIIETNGLPLPIPYEPASLAQALRQGLLYCDRFLAYMVRCILPGIVAIGGTSQQDYVKLYRKMLLETHRETPFLTEFDIHEISRPDLSRLGGRPLVELSGDTLDLITYLSPETRLVNLEEEFLNRSVGETIGHLRCASYFEKLLRSQEKINK